MAELSSFQVECETCLRDVLDVTGRELAAREVLGDTRKCVHLLIRGVDVEIWILDNQVEYRLGDNQFNFEESYYGKSERTIQEFAAALRKDLEIHGAQ